MSLFRQSISHISSLPFAFWIVIIATLMNQLGNMAMVFLILYLTQHSGWSLPHASVAFAVVSASLLAGGLIGGSLIDKFGAARIQITSLAINGFILLLFPFFSQHFVILTLCLLWGLAFGIYRPASQTFVSILSKPGMNKITFSIYRLVINLGMSIGPAIGGYLASHSFRAIFWLNGISNLLATIILLIGLSYTTWLRYRPLIPAQIELNLIWLKRDPSLRLIVLALIPVCMIFYQHETTFGVFLHDMLKLPLSFYGLLFTLNTLVIVFFELPLNVATIHWRYRITLMLGSFFVALGFAGMAFATSRWHLIGLTLIWTIGEMILFPSSASYIADIAPEHRRGVYMSFYTTASNLGLLAGPLLGGIVMEHLGASSLWILCGFWGLISVVLFYFLSEPKSKVLA